MWVLSCLCHSDPHSVAIVAIVRLLVSERMKRSKPLIVVGAEMIDLVVVVHLVARQVIFLHSVAIVILIDLR